MSVFSLHSQEMKLELISKYFPAHKAHDVVASGAVRLFKNKGRIPS